MLKIEIFCALNILVDREDQVIDNILKIAIQLIDRKDQVTDNISKD